MKKSTKLNENISVKYLPNEFKYMLKINSAGFLNNSIETELQLYNSCLKNFTSLGLFFTHAFTNVNKLVSNKQNNAAKYTILRRMWKGRTNSLHIFK